VEKIERLVATGPRHAPAYDILKSDLQIPFARAANARRLHLLIKILKAAFAECSVPNVELDRGPALQQPDGVRRAFPSD